jgi:hypothetical protein
MTVRSYLHSCAKRAEATTLLDSGATENFINLQYARWLKLPIKQLEHPRKLVNVDGTENKAGALRYYTDLQVRTGTTNTKTSILPLRSRGAQSNTWLPLVRGGTTKHRLETGMDRSYPITHRYSRG